MAIITNGIRDASKPPEKPKLKKKVSKSNPVLLIPHTIIKESINAIIPAVAVLGFPEGSLKIFDAAILIKAKEIMNTAPKIIVEASTLASKSLKEKPP